MRRFLYVTCWLLALFLCQGDQLQAEDKLISADGRLTNATGPKPSKAAQPYTASFTAKYPDIAAVNPVYAQLRNQIGSLVAAAFIRQQDYYGRVSWDARLLMDESQLPTETLPNPTKVDCAINVLWKGNRLLCPAGGGVSIQADEALRPERLISDEQGGTVSHARQSRRRNRCGPMVVGLS